MTKTEKRMLQKRSDTIWLKVVESWNLAQVADADQEVLEKFLKLSEACSELQDLLYDYED